MGDAQGKMSDSLGGLELRLKYHLNREKGGELCPLRGQEIIFRKMNGPLEEQMGSVLVCDKVCLGVVSTSSFLSCDKSPSSLVDETPRQGVYDNWFLLGDLSTGR